MLTRRFRTTLVGFFAVAFEGNDSLSLCKVYSVLHHSAYHIGIAVSRFTDTLQSLLILGKDDSCLGRPLCTQPLWQAAW